VTRSLFDRGPVTELATVSELAARGAFFALNDSGGKDSQAMRLRVCAALGGFRVELAVVHATLGEVEWPGALEHARDGAERRGLPFIVARARRGLLQMVTERHATRPGVPSWPSAKHRQCTSDLKRGPITREVRRYAKSRGLNLVVNCLGLRAEESSNRARKPALVRNTELSVAGREWWDWLPIHHLTTEEVFETIARHGEAPHPAYAAGNERLSCVFCILGSARDARNGAVHNPELFARYVEMERATGYTAHQSRRSLEEVAGLTVEEARTLHRLLPVVRSGDA